MKLTREKFFMIISSAIDLTMEEFSRMLVKENVTSLDACVTLAREAQRVGKNAGATRREQIARVLGIELAPYDGPKFKLSRKGANLLVSLMLIDKKIQAIKVVRENTGLGLKEAKDVVELLEPGCRNFNDVFEVEGGAIDAVNVTEQEEISKIVKEGLAEAQQENQRLRAEIHSLQEDLRRLQDDIRDETARAARANDDASEAEEACRDIRELRVSHIKGVLRNGEEIDLDFGTIPVCLHAVLNLIENAQDTRHELAD